MKNLFLIAAATLALAGGSQAAVVSAYNITSAAGTHNSGSWDAIGFEFTTTTAISVTYLGVHDWYSNGLATATQVAIYNSTGTQVAGITVPAGTAASLAEAGSFGTDYLQILTTPVTLAPGTYLIVNSQSTGIANSQDLAYGVSATFSPEISYGRGWYLAGTGVFQDPRFATSGNHGSDTANPKSYIGPQFKYDTIPEAGVSTLLLGVAGLSFLRRRR